MNPDLIAQLRAESLAATLTSARSRRWRRRAAPAALAVIIMAVIALALLPRRDPAAIPIAVAQPAAAPVFSPSAQNIRTAPAPVARIATRATALVRFSTDPASRTERIDNAGLARSFPDKGIAVIRVEGELAKVVIF